MIYLIGGSPRCGKTKIAKALAKKTHIPWFPADYLGAVIFQYVPEDEHDAKFPLSAIKDKNPTNDYRFSEYTPKEILDFYHTQAAAVWPGLRAFIKYAAHDKQDFILEGYQITPALLAQLDEESKKSINPAFVYKQDVVDIEAGIKKNMDPGDWLLRNTHDESTYAKAAEMVRAFGARTLQEAEQNRMSVFSMDGEFENNVDTVVEYLFSHMNSNSSNV